jgi:hypothetical protein
MKKVTLLVAALAIAFCGFAQKLGGFDSSVEKKVGPKTVAVPYTDVVSYLGYAAPNTEDEIKDGKKFYYVYVWIPLAAPELGVRMMSPVGDTKIKDATKSADYEKNAASTDYFDTYITLERSNIVKTEDITPEKVKTATWTTLERNDDSGEMPKQPSGSSYNSLLRYKSEASDPAKAITIGLYRVGFTTYKTGEVKGTFLAEVGAPVKLPGVAVAKTIADLNAAIAGK